MLKSMVVCKPAKVDGMLSEINFKETCSLKYITAIQFCHIFERYTQTTLWAPLQRFP